MSSRRRSNIRRKASVRSAVPQSPGHYLTVGSKDRESIHAVQARLNQVGCGPIGGNGIFNKQTKVAAQLFQARSVDRQGRSLNPEPLSPLLQTALAVSASQIGVMEHPLGRNTVPEVEKWISIWNR